MTFTQDHARRFKTAAVLAVGVVFSTAQFAGAVHVDHDGAANNGSGDNRFGEFRPTPEGFVDGQKYDDQSNPQYDGDNDFDGNNGTGDDKNRDAFGAKTNGNKRG